MKVSSRERKQGFKRFFSILTVFLLIFSNFNGIIARAAGADAQSITIKVDKAEVTPDDEVLVSLTSAGMEDISSMDVYYHLPNDKSVGVVARYNESDNSFEAKVPIGKYAASGLWEVTAIDLYYPDGHKEEVLPDETDLTKGNFTVSNENGSLQDIETPIFNGVTVDKKEAAPGETVKVTIDATDKLSGISNVKLIYQGPGESKNLVAVLNEQTQKYEASLVVGDNDQPGTWSISDLVIGDYSGNSYVDSSSEKLATGEFNVVEKSVEVEDTKAPIVNSISVDKTEARPGDTVTATIDASDDVSGIDEIWVYYIEGNQSGSQQAVLNPDTNKYEVKFQIDETSRPGDWGVYGIDLRDKANNDIYLSEWNDSNVDFTKGTFQVINENVDGTPPTINSVMADKQDAQPGDTVTVSIDASDDKSGIDSLEVNYYGSNGGNLTNNAEYNSDTKKYEAKFTIDENTRPGLWKIESIIVSDSEGNSNWINQDSGVDLKGGNFKVINDQVDITAPVLKSVKVDKADAQPGDTVTVSIEAEDEQSGIDYVNVQYEGPKGGHMEEEAVYNSETQKYEAQFSIGDGTRPGTWRIESINLRDKNRNESWIDQYSEFELSDGDFTVNNDLIDMEPPVVNSVSVDQKEAKPGDTVTVSINASDAKSTIERITVDYNVGNHDVERVADLNPDTGMYDAKVKIGDYDNAGKWSINYISVEDSEYNSKEIYNGEEQDLSGGDFTVVNENADVTPPAIQGISVDKTEVRPGDKVTVSVDAKDDQSGIDTIRVEYQGSNGGYMNEEAVYNSDTKKYEATLTIDEWTRPGVWKVSSIYVMDKQYNYTWMGENDELERFSASFTVINEDADITPPTVQGITVDQNEVKPGDVVKISVDAKDDKSDISYVSIEYKNPYGGYKGRQAVYNEESGKYEAKFPITDQTKPGKWTVNYIEVEDKFGNNEMYLSEDGFDFSSGDFNVTNENADLAPPTIKAVSVDKTEAKLGETVTVSIDASDDKSGVDSILVDFRAGTRFVWNQEANYNPETEKYEVKLPITETSRPGAWSIYTIFVKDKAGNENEIYSDEQDFSNADFMVTNDRADVTPPTVNSVSVDKKEAQLGDTVTVSFDVSDERSAIENVQAGFKVGNRYQWESAEYNQETKKYEVKLPINESSRPGTWSISSMYVSDIEGNGESINSEDQDFSSADFTVINDKADLSPPTVKTVSVDKKEAQLGDTVTVSIDASDGQSGVDTVSVWYRNSDGRSWWGDATYNEQTQKYEAKYSITDTTRPGTWSLSNIYVTDKEGNEQNYYNDDDNWNFNNANFNVTNDKVDVTPPSIKEVSVNPKEAKPGDEVTVSIDAEDTQSGIQSLFVNYQGPKNTGGSREAVINPDTGKYEAKIKISEFAASGTWKIDGINVIDNQDNSDYIFNNKVNGYPGASNMDLSAGNFNVINDNEDITAPEVTGIKINKEQFAPGETAVIELDVNDSQSGVSSVSIAYTGSNGGYYESDAEYDEATKKYIARIPVNNKTKPGLWTVDSIYVTDKEGNSDYLNGNLYDFSNTKYTVINDAVDLTPPSVNSVTVSQKEGKPGDKITVSLDVTDKQSSVSNVSVAFKNKNDKDFWRDTGEVWENAVYNEQTHQYEVTFPISETSKPGTWVIDYVSVSDSEGNWKDIYNGQDADLSAGDFTVINDLADVTSPEFKGISVDKKEVNVGEDITFTVEAADSQSGIRDVYIGLDGGMDVYTGEYNPDTKKYEVKIPITKGYKPGTWKVNFVAIYDKDNNGIYLDGNEEDFIGLNFEIINPDYDDYQNYFDSYINSISIDKKDAVPGDYVTLSLKFKDSSKIRDVSVRYVGSSEAEFHKDAVYNEKTETYDVKIPISSLFKPGAWSLNGIYVTEIDDQHGEYLSFGPDEIAALGNGDFSVSNKDLDSTPPAAPVVDEVSDQSVTVTGYTESKAKVVVKSGDQELGNAIADSDGHFIISINAQKAGTKLTVISIDSSGNVGEGTEVTVKDVTPPAVPIVKDVTDHAKEVTGTAEVGAKVTVKIGDKEYNGTADKDGNFIVTIPVQAVGTKITVVATDEAGNASEENAVTVKDATPPAAPVVKDVTNQSKEVTGTAEAGSKITVKIGDKEYTGTADKDGNFSVTIPVQIAGTKLTVIAIDAAGNASDETTVTVKDVTVPAAPKVNEVTDQSKEVMGTAEVAAKVTVKIGDNEYTGTADKAGNFTITIPVQAAGTKITVIVTDGAGNASEAATVVVKDVTAPSAPKVNQVSDLVKEVTGTTEASAKVTVTIGSSTYTGKADTNGNFKVAIPQQKAGTKITITVADGNGNVSPATNVTVVDKTAPNVLTVNSVSDQAKEVTGTTEAIATVTVTVGTKQYTAKADAKGTYKVSIPQQKTGTKITVTAKDVAGNSVSKTITVVDKTPPSIPTVNTVTDQSKVVTGKAEAGSTVTVVIGSKKYTAKADTKGNYKITIPVQKAGTKVSVSAKDAAGNTSKSKTITVIDKTAPKAPTVDAVKSTSTVVTGKTEAYASITIKVGKKVIGTGKADKYGKFKVKIKAQKKKTVLSVTATDTAKNVSKATTIKVK